MPIFSQSDGTRSRNARNAQLFPRKTHCAALAAEFPMAQPLPTPLFDTDEFLAGEQESSPADEWGCLTDSGSAPLMFTYALVAIIVIGFFFLLGVWYGQATNYSGKAGV